MLIKLNSSKLEATFSSQGAELISLKDKQGIEYIWQGREGFWPGHSPLLFPICGSLKNGEYSHQGKVYQMGSHGFAGKSEFSIIDQSADRVVFVLQETAESLSQFPFKFVLRLTYYLTESELKVDYSVENSGAEELPYSLGWHPGFICNWQADDKIEDYRLEFDSVDGAQRRMVLDGALISRATTGWDESGFALKLEELSDKGLVLDCAQMSKVRLLHKSLDKSVTLNFSEFQFLVLWWQKGADFVCIEPWQGMGDLEDHSGELKEKFATEILPAGETKTFSCSLELV